MAGPMNKRIEVPGPRESLQVVSRPIPQPPPHGLVVKNHYAGICHSDVHEWRDEWRMTDDFVCSITSFIPSFQWPAVMGHEISGEVYSLGSEYKGELKVGDRVVVYSWCGCEDCEQCKAGDGLMCLRFSEFNVGIGADGGYQQYTSILNGQYALPAPEGIPMEVLSTMSCSGLTSLNAISKLKLSVQRACRNSEGAKVLVIGTGGLGMWGIQWAKAILPPNTKVFAADISEEKLAGALKQGADATILWDRAVSDDELVALTKETTGGGVDGSADFVGLASTGYKAVMSANKGGTCVLVGLAGGTLRLPAIPIILGDKTVTGALCGSLEQMMEQLQIYEEKNLKSPPITLVKPEEAERCLRELHAGTFQGRYVIDWTKE